MDIPDLEGTPFGDLFRRFFGDGESSPETDPTSLGSGFFISRDGFILTNNHVVEGAETVIVRLHDRRQFNAEVVGTDPRSDIAVLKIDAEDLPAVQIGSTTDLKVGEWVLAIGSPFGFDHTVTAGIVSAKGRSLPNENYVPFIQTDVAINPGNSGGPLFNLDGEVVGVNAQIYSRTGGFMGLSFAIPIEMAMEVADQLKSDGRVVRGWLGVVIQEVTRELAESFDMDRAYGALVARVLPNSPAQEAGLEVGDVIIRFNGAEVASSTKLPPMVGRTRVGEAARLSVLRKGESREMEVVIGELPENLDLGSIAPDDGSAFSRTLGLRVIDTDEELRAELDIEGGVVVQAVEPGPAARAGIRQGDVIVMLDNRAVDDTRRFVEIAEELEPNRSVAVLVQRGEGPLFLALRLDEGE